MIRCPRWISPARRPQPLGARRRPPWMLAAALALPLSLSACAGAMQLLEESRPTANVRGARLSDLSLSGVRLTVDVEVTNNLPVAVPLVGLDWALATSGQPFLSGAIEPGGTVLARGTRLVPVPVEILFSELLSAVTSLRPGEVVPYAIDLGLSVNLPGGEEARLPLRHEGSLPVPVLPSVQVSEIRLDELSLQSARGIVRLEVGNANAFPLQVETLGYGLRLGNVSIAEGTTSAPEAIAPGASLPLEIPLEISPMAAGAAIFQTLSSGRSSYTLDGQLAVGTPFGDMEMEFGSSGQTEIER